MNIKIGEKIKSLRKKADVTQEKFAEYLGITPQAVSRWESETAYPDIEIIPAIANFFSISTDELFGIDQNKNKERISEVHQKLKDYDAKGLHDKSIEVLRKAIQEFPSNYSFLRLLSHTLSKKSDLIYDKENEEKKALNEESVAILERVLADAPGEQYGTLLHLAYAYQRAGNQEKSIETANKLPMEVYSREIVLCNILTGEDKILQLEKVIESYTDTLSYRYRMLAGEKYADAKYFDEKVMLNNKAIKLYEIMCEDGNYGFYHNRISDIYYALFRLYFNKNDKDNAVLNLEKAAYHAVEYDKDETVENNRGFVYTSIALKRESNVGFGGSYGMSDNFNQCQGLLNNLTNLKKDKSDFDKYQELMIDDEKAGDVIEKKLEKYAKIYE